jgi:hypothetical protein
MPSRPKERQGPNDLLHDAKKVEIHFCGTGNMARRVRDFYSTWDTHELDMQPTSYSRGVPCRSWRDHG